MNKPESVVGCSTCGALYTPAPGDRGVCSTCSSFLPEDPPAQPASSPRPASGRVAAAGFSRPYRSPGKRRTLRRVAIATIALAIVGAIGSAFVFRRQMVRDAWSSVQRRSPTEAWTAIRGLASNGWLAVRRHLPFESLQGEQSASVVTPKSSRLAIRDAGEARGTRRRGKAVAKK